MRMKPKLLQIRHKTMSTLYYVRIAVFLVASLALVSCDRKPTSYGPLEFKSIGGYAAYVVKDPDSSAEVLLSQGNSPTGIGGSFTVPKSHRWGVFVFMNFGFEQLLADLEAASCPELLVYDWDSGGKGFSEKDILKIASAKSLRRLDLQLYPTLSDKVVREVAKLPQLEELWLPASGGVSDDTIAAILKQNSSLRVKRGDAPRAASVGKRVIEALNRGR